MLDKFRCVNIFVINVQLSRHIHTIVNTLNNNQIYSIKYFKLFSNMCFNIPIILSNCINCITNCVRKYNSINYNKTIQKLN